MITLKTISLEKYDKQIVEDSIRTRSIKKHTNFYDF